MPSKKHVTQEIANTLLSGSWTLEECQQRLTQTFGYLPEWVKPLLLSLHTHFESQFPNIDSGKLALFITDHPQFEKHWDLYRLEHGRNMPICNYSLQLPTSVSPNLACDNPVLDTTKALAEWLNLSDSQLEGFADCHGLERKSASLRQRHYHYTWKEKRSKLSARLLEIPKSNLRTIQRQINTDILQAIPLHSTCHGFRKDHSCLTYAQPHCSKPVVIRMDLQGFFTFIPMRQIHAIFRTIGYRKEVARLLTGLCTNQVPHSVIKTNTTLSWNERKRYSEPHLPQGSPTSPALSNLAAFMLDVRLDALMRSLSGQYTRYADDLAFSGNFSNTLIHQLHAQITHIAMSEGFHVNTRKTKIMRQNVRQSLTGLVVNKHLNYPRHTYDNLKATLYNCKRYGAASQNRLGHSDFRAYLLGKIAYVKSITPKKAVRLEQLFSEINWEIK